MHEAPIVQDENVVRLPAMGISDGIMGVDHHTDTLPASYRNNRALTEVEYQSRCDIVLTITTSYDIIDRYLTINFDEPEEVRVS